MLLYEYPQKMSRSDRQLKAAADLQQHKKIRSNVYRNIFMGAVIFALSMLVSVMVIKIILMLIAAGNIVTAVLVYGYFNNASQQLPTKIYQDRLEHSQRIGFSGRIISYTIYFDEIEMSNQDNLGRLNIKMKDVCKSTIQLTDKHKKTENLDFKDKTAVLKFMHTPPKLKLINEFYEEIKYPHKEYNVIEDEDDYYSEEDLKWDRLHKHGL